MSDDPIIEALFCNQQAHKVAARDEVLALRARIDELNRMKSWTWTEHEMAEAQWTFTFHIHRDDGEYVLAHELAHAVQRFRWPDDEAHSSRHAELVVAIAEAIGAIE